MDTKTAEKISRLAKSLKELHLVGTYDEAYSRAREIIIKSGSDDEKSIKELYEEVGGKAKEEKPSELNKEISAVKEEEEKEIDEELADIGKEQEELEKIEKELDDAKKALERDELKHKDKAEIKEEVEQEFKEEEEALELADENITVAEEVQEKKT